MALGCIIVGVTCTNAAVIFQSDLSISVFSIGNPTEADIDINDDGLADVSLSNDGVEFGILPLQGTQVLATPPTPPNLVAAVVANEIGSIITSNSEATENEWLSRLELNGLEVPFGLRTCFSGNCTGQYDAGTHYIGIRIRDAEEYNHAWIEVSVPFDGVQGGTITGFAYETIPGRSIVAGAIPEPNSAILSILALAYIAIHRRRPFVSILQC